MTESSVSSPFMTELRRTLPGSVVVKHRDASMIGLPDCSASWMRKTLWLEFKLVTIKKEGLDYHVQVGNRSKKTICSFYGESSNPGRLCQAVAAASPAQFEMMKKLGAQAFQSLYIVWIRKVKRILIWNPLQPDQVRECRDNKELAIFLGACFHHEEGIKALQQ